jgi:hypothetical protein
MKVFLGRFYDPIEYRIGEIASAEYPQGKKEGF